MKRPSILVIGLAASLLTGCATTQADYGNAQALPDGNGYYVPAQNGDGDYYYGEPQVQAVYAGSPWQFGYGFGFGSGLYGFGTPWFALGPGPWWGFGPGPWWWYPPHHRHHPHTVLPVTRAVAAQRMSQRDARPMPLQARAGYRPMPPPRREPAFPAREFREPHHSSSHERP